MYVQMLWMLSIGIMLDTDEQNIRILSGMIDNENVNDALYDFFNKIQINRLGKDVLTQYCFQFLIKVHCL